MIGGAADNNPDDNILSEAELTALTLAQLKELAVEHGLTLTQTTKSNIIAEILEDLYPSSLSALALGTLTLTPTFAAGTTSYAASTTNATDKLAVTATDPNAEVTVKLGSTAITAGTDGKYEITWEVGSNTVTVKVTNGYQGEVDTTYTLTVTAS